jgi:putative endonuclease
MVRCSDDSLYTGYTTDIEKRIVQHNSEKIGAKYTKARRPVVLVYTENFESKGDAMRREIEIKSFTRSQKLSLINL